jgi:hypothetical protein
MFIILREIELESLMLTFLQKQLIDTEREKVGSSIKKKLNDLLNE